MALSYYQYAIYRPENDWKLDIADVAGKVSMDHLNELFLLFVTSDQ